MLPPVGLALPIGGLTLPVGGLKLLTGGLMLPIVGLTLPVTGLMLPCTGLPGGATTVAELLGGGTGDTVEDTGDIGGATDTGGPDVAGGYVEGSAAWGVTDS